MATTARQNGTAKKETTTPKQEVKKQLAKDATKPGAKQPLPASTSKTEKPAINLDERIDRFEKLRGIVNQRERLVNTLTELARFNYNSAESCTFSLTDAAGLEFNTTNTNLIKLVAGELQKTLETRKTELEKELIEFQL